MVKSLVCWLSDYSAVDSPPRECVYDVGGYFIINGTEKVVIGQEKLKTNFPYVFPARASTRFALQAEVRSCHESKVRSTSTISLFLNDARHGSAQEVMVAVPFIQRHVPLLVLYRILGVDSIEAMFRTIAGDAEAAEHRWGQRFVLMARAVLDVDNAVLDGDGNTVSLVSMPLEDLCNWVGVDGGVTTGSAAAMAAAAIADGISLAAAERAHRIKAVQHIVTNEVFPHVGLDNSLVVRKRKAHYLGYVVRKLLLVSLTPSLADDRDHYANKRVDSAGVSMALIFRQRFRAFLKGLQFALSKQIQNGMQYINVVDSINSKTITAGLYYAFSTGNWGVQKGATGSTQTGVAQVLTRMNLAATIANMCQINTPINRDGKNPGPRKLHPSHWMIVCPVKTPEGASTGLIKNLALLTHVRVGYDPRFIERRLDLCAQRFGLVHLDILLDEAGDCEAENVSPSADCRGGSADFTVLQTCVLVNGRVYGYVASAAGVSGLVAHLRTLRRHGMVPFDVSIVHRAKQREVSITTDSGCLLRPVLALNEFYARYDDLVETTERDQLWTALLREGVVVYIDKEEELDMCIATYWSQAERHHTHAELHPSLMFSSTASFLPFPETNQAPRNMYYSSMAGQAVGMFSSNPSARFDTVAHQLWYVRKRLGPRAVPDEAAVASARLHSRV
jgi:DNA-directed RNA polymerase II subunit RPB2